MEIQVMIGSPSRIRFAASRIIIQQVPRQWPKRRAQMLVDKAGEVGAVRFDLIVPETRSSKNIAMCHSQRTAGMISSF